MLASTALALVAAYENKSGWKMDGDHIAVDSDGNPIYLTEAGAEMSVQHGTIGRLNNESKGHRERAEAAEAKLAKYDGLDDPEAARNALQTVKDLKDGDLINKGKVDEVKAEITRTYETKLTDLQKSLDDQKRANTTMRLETAFKSSDFLRDNLAVPIDMVQATFASRFKDEDGKLVPYGQDGQPVYSKKRAGEVADFEEAMGIFVETHPQRDLIVKAPDARGSGNNGGGGNRGSGRFVKRADFDAMTDPTAKADIAMKMGTGEVTIVD